MPAKAGIHVFVSKSKAWMPAFAGMTEGTTALYKHSNLLLSHEFALTCGGACHK
jgi:hypothetical protein